ncbi:hypothetical protein ACEPAG_2322 [Sanghuangporus baumii]
MAFTNPWSDPRNPHVLGSPFEQHGESAITSVQQYAETTSQRANRIGPIRTMASGEFQSHSRSSVSSLSSAMGTASPSLQRPRPSPDHSSSSSPSSDGSNQSHHQRKLPLQWDMGLSGVGVSNLHSTHAQDLLSPGNTQAALLLEGLDVNRSPYTPSSTLSDLPEGAASVFAMSHGAYTASPVSRFYSTQRSSSMNGMGQSSPTMAFAPYPQSAPADHMVFGNPGMTLHGTPSPPNTFAAPSSSSSTSEVERLKQYIRELQNQNQELSSRVEQLQSEVNVARIEQASRLMSPGEALASSSYNLSSRHMDESWRRRTDARVRKFCSPNRAGNALCAWHDTRRERRAYPPRMAPAGTLNCGCTVEEALFEESLARHGVGSYLPGDSVRMDPALRNPLLHLLETRYGYRDGDFERDPLSGQWLENEGPERWEAELQRGAGKAHRALT